MLVHVKRDELLAIAAQTAKAAPKTATSEAVLGIHVEADSRRSMLTLTATNYEIVIRASMGASVEQSGSVVISAALFPAAIIAVPSSIPLDGHTRMKPYDLILNSNQAQPFHFHTHTCKAKRPVYLGFSLWKLPPVFQISCQSYQPFGCSPSYFRNSSSL